MNRKNRRAVVRASILRELAGADPARTNRVKLTNRQRAAAMFLDRDRDLANGVSAGLVASYAERIASDDGPLSRCMVPGALDAASRYKAVMDVLPSSMREFWGTLNLVEAQGKTSFLAVPAVTGKAADREHALVVEGMVRSFLDCVADAYRVPAESGAA